MVIILTLVADGEGDKPDGPPRLAKLFKSSAGDLATDGDAENRDRLVAWSKSGITMSHSRRPFLPTVHRKNFTFCTYNRL